MNQSLHIWVSSSSLGNSNRDSDVSIFEILFLLVPDVRSNAIDNGVLISNNMLEFFLVCEILQLNISFVSHISSWLDFLELDVPDGRGVSVWVNAGGSNSSQS